MSRKEQEMLNRLSERPLQNVGLAQQCFHMAVAACENLGLDFEHTSPEDIAKAIDELLDTPRWSIVK